MWRKAIINVTNSSLVLNILLDNDKTLQGVNFWGTVHIINKKYIMYTQLI